MCSREARVCPCKLIEIFGMINPLQTTKSGRGIVSVRVALLLRFTEIKPCSYDLFRLYNHFDLRHELILSPPLRHPGFTPLHALLSFISIPCSSGAPLFHLLSVWFVFLCWGSFIPFQVCRRGEARRGEAKIVVHFEGPGLPFDRFLCVSLFLLY